MNIKLLFLTAFCFGLNLLSAQITIDNSTFPSAGDTLLTAIDNLPNGISYGDVGGDQVWDFSSLQAPFTNQRIYLEANAGMAAEAFPTADMVTSFGEAGEAYYAAEGDALLFLGYNGQDPAGLGIELSARLSPPSVERRAPMNFLDINTSAYDVNLPFSVEELPEAVLETLPITPDSLRIRIASTRTDVVDAWGSMTIPGGDYDVLREKRIEYRSTNMDVKIGQFPWQDVTDLVPFPDFLGVDTVITYNYFSNEAKEPIAIVTVSADESTVERVEYKSIDTSTSTVRPISAKADLIAYPNPAIDSARFEFSNVKRGAYKLRIYNILGVVVWEDTYHVSGNKTVAVDLSKLRKGTYLYSLQNEEEKTLLTKRLLIIRP